MSVNELLLVHTAFIGLGSNMGDREQLLKEAVIRLDQSSGIRVSAVSRLYETDPAGFLDQPLFLNMAVRISTSHAPLSLLDVLLAIELELGRVRTVRWGPRTIDMDMLLYDEITMDTPELTLPHPRMQERAFVLIPLLDVLTGGPHPQVEARRLSGHKDGVKVWKTIKWPEEFGLFAN